jgi:hypothetical protein
MLPSNIDKWNQTQEKVLREYEIFLALDERPSTFTVHLPVKCGASTLLTGLAMQHSAAKNCSVCLLVSSGHYEYQRMLGKYDLVWCDTPRGLHFKNASTDSSIRVVNDIDHIVTPVDILFVDYNVEIGRHSQSKIKIPVGSHIVQFASSSRLDNVDIKMGF